MASSTETLRTIAAACFRGILPATILIAGWIAYSYLAVEVPNEQATTDKAPLLRTRVKPLTATDYQVVIRTNAIVQAHNRVTLTAEVTGAAIKIHSYFEAGAFFSKGDVLVEIDPRNYASALSIAKARLQAAQSALELARLEEQRKLRLIERKAVSQAEVDVASANREQAQADLDLAKAEVERAKVDLERTKVVAPFDGRVQSRSIGLGQMASPNTPLGEIFAVDFAEVRLPISARQRGFLSLPEDTNDPPVPVVLKDAIVDTTTTWSAEIVRSEGVLDQDSRDLFAIARVNDPFGRKSGRAPLRVGQPVVASINGIELREVVALPRSAVRQLDRIVLVDKQDNTLLPMTIEAIWSDADQVIVEKSAIPTGMWLATTPMVYTPQGAKVEIISGQTSADAIAESVSPASSETSNN